MIQVTVERKMRNIKMRSRQMHKLGNTTIASRGTYFIGVTLPLKKNDISARALA